MTEHNVPSSAPAGTTPGRNTVGLVALVVAVVGTVLACLSATVIVGWAMLAVGLVLGIVGVCRSGQTKTVSIAAIVVSLLGAVVAAVAFVSLLGSAVARTDSHPDLTGHSAVPGDAGEPQPAGARPLR